MPSVHDPDFGAMHFDGSAWILDRRAVFNGVDLLVKIEPESSDALALSPVQREAVRIVLSLPPDVLEVSAPAVLQNYEVYREMIGDEELPPLGVQTEVWQRVEPSYLVVPPHGNTSIPTFLLFAECDWDPEHGLAVRFRNGYADASNQQGELRLES